MKLATAIGSMVFASVASVACQSIGVAIDDGATSASESGQVSADIDSGADVDAGVGSGPLPFQVLGDRSRIELVSQDTVEAGGRRWNRSFYRNLAYRCGRTGYFTFLVLERADTARQTRPLWVYLHGGSVGYYDDAGTYHGPEWLNDEESQEVLTSHVSEGVSGNEFSDNALGRRLAEGHRLLVPSMCDHDLYAGHGQTYPNNPNWADGDRVEGLWATTAALHFAVTSKGAKGARRWPTSFVYLQGASAGSAGVWHVGSALARIGIRINGALMDSYVITPRVRALAAEQCSPVNSGDPSYEVAQLEAKVGEFLTDESLYLENNFPPPFPVFDLVGDEDPYCCGQLEPIAAATDAGFSNNCRYVRAEVARRMAEMHQPTVQSLVEPGYGHVIAGEAGPHQQALEAWFQAVIATPQTPPVFPP